MSTQSDNKEKLKSGFSQRLGVSVADRKFLVGSLFLHVVVFTLLAVSWHSSEKVKAVQLPASMQARVLSAEELKALRSKREQEQRKIEDKKKRAELEKKRKQKKLREKAKRKKAEAKRKKEARRKEDARKKALIREKKKKKEKERKAQEERQRKKEAEKKRLKKLEKEKQLQDEKQKAQKQSEREQRLLERMREAEVREAQLQKQLESDRLTEQLARDQKLALEREISETERFYSLIKSRIESRWHIPPNSKGLSVILRIKLLPTGELSGVRLLESSSQGAMDQSALSAVRSVKLFPVPQNKAVFEKYFRQFTMSFSPET